MRRTKIGFTLIELMIVVAIIGLLSAIAIPNFVSFQTLAKQSEAKTNLKALYTAQKSFYAEHDSYSSNGAEVGWAPEQHNRYAYDLGGPGVWTRPGQAPSGSYGVVLQDTSVIQSPVTLAVSTIPMSAGVTGPCPNCGFEATAASNLDSDGAQDEWLIFSEPPAFVKVKLVVMIIGPPSGSTCPANLEPGVVGVPYQATDDVSCDK
jgi:type IV pilus assembly protein PilA